ncbi:MAG: TIGR03960 family B12-binding radical SAM protein [Synergistaceae bacterium]|nr:TIGR03960 family B12-binding radical SAM protein [Synergistaceae bacterium]
MLSERGTDPRRSILASVKRPSRYTGGEWGSGPVKSSDSDLVRVCYAFPDVYEVGMSYVGYQILYGLTKSLPYADAERVYTPWPDMEEALRSSGTKLWALESRRPVSDFDVLAVTLQYELSYTNILTILDLADIPFRSENRGEGDPIVIAGGPGALAPEPMAPFIDAFCVGDGEVLVPEVLSTIHGLKGKSRTEIITALSKIQGVYVPLMKQDKPVRRRIVEDLDSAFYNTEMIVPNTGIVHDRIAVQVFKGCTRGCRFCQAGMIDRPVRERSAASVANQIEKLLENTGWEEVGLLSLATCDWSQMGEILKRFEPMLKNNQIKLSLPSLRVDAFSVNLAAELESIRKGGLTFAPEAGTQRLRNVINKGVSNEDIESALEATFSHGWDRVKLYFMMGLPTEKDEDLAGIHEICNMAVSIAKKHKRRGDINVSLAGFVPKAHTPFQWEPQLDRFTMKERGRWVKNNIKNRKVTLSYHEPEQTYIEGVFARGDSKLADAIEEAWKRGERFDGWSEFFNFERWMEVFNDLGIDPDTYACRGRAQDETLPWDHIDSGVSKFYLIKERQKALGNELTPDCREGCNFCGWQGRTAVEGCSNG